MTNDDRGELLVGKAAIAKHVFKNKRRRCSIKSLQHELGLFWLNKRLCGYSGIIDARIDAKVKAALAGAESKEVI
jgi:hypothetical protein